MTAYHDRLTAGDYLPPKQPKPKPEQESTTEKLDDAKDKTKNDSE